MKVIHCCLLAAALSLPADLSYADGKESAMKVLVAPVVREQLQQTLPLSGTLVSPQLSNLSARVSGTVKTLHVDIGDRVVRGQPLMSLDDTIAKLNLQSTEAARDEAEVLHQNAQRLADEALRLANSNHLSQTELQTRQSQAKAAQARVLQLNVQHSVQAEQLNRHTLHAPFDGVIASKLTETGQWVNDASAVLTLSQMNPLYLEVQVPERFFGQLQQGASVALSTNRDNGPASARIERIVPVSNPKTRTFLVRAQVANSDWALLPGMSVKAQLPLNTSSAEALQVPVDAIVRKANGSHQVWVVRNGENSRVAQPVEVAIGRSAGNRVEIRSTGLNTGDLVVILGNEDLKAGQPVAIEGER